MTKPREILVAVDFGEASGRAVAIAGALAARCEAEMRLIHAEPSDVPPYFTTDQLARLERERQQLRAQAERYLTKFGQQHTTRPFTPSIDDRAPVEAILSEAASADLVITGTHGRRGPARWWLGSVAERVLREIDRPLMVVRNDTPVSPALAFSRAVVHAEAPATGDRASAYAREIVDCFGGHVVGSTGGTAAEVVAESGASLLVVAIPRPTSHGWLPHAGEPLLRSCHVPILFVPEILEGAKI